MHNLWKYCYGVEELHSRAKTSRALLCLFFFPLNYYHVVSWHVLILINVFHVIWLIHHDPLECSSNWNSNSVININLETATRNHVQPDTYSATTEIHRGSFRYLGSRPKFAPNPLMRCRQGNKKPENRKKWNSVGILIVSKLKGMENTTDGTVSLPCRFIDELMN